MGVGEEGVHNVRYTDNERIIRGEGINDQISLT